MQSNVISVTFMIFNKLPYRISLNKVRSIIMVFNCNMNAFSRLTSIINLYNENMNLKMTIKKCRSVYELRVSRSGDQKRTYFFILALLYRIFRHISMFNFCCCYLL